MSTKKIKTGNIRLHPAILKNGLFKKDEIVLVLQEEIHEVGRFVTDGYGGYLSVDNKYWVNASVNDCSEIKLTKVVNHE